MAFDAFMKVKDCEGESTDEKHKGWVEIHSYSFGVHQSGQGARSASGGGIVERASFTDFSITKHLDKTSPKLFLYAANGTHVDVTIELCRATGQKQKYMEIKLEHVTVSAYHQGANKAGQLPTEQVSFNAGKMEIEYEQLDEKGKSKGKVKQHWDLTQNKGG